MTARFARMTSLRSMTALRAMTQSFRH